MSAGTSEFFCLICFFVCSCSAQTIISTDLGKNVILPCKAPDNNDNNNNIIVLEWIKPGLETEYVLFYRDGHFDPEYQDPSYKNRVDLQDKQMKDGDVSLVLKEVKKNDTGRYECRVFQMGTHRKKRSNLDNDPINIINLEVLPSGDKDGGNMVGVLGGSVMGAILLLLVVASVVFLIYRRHMKKNPNLSVPPDEAAGQPML